MTIITRKDAIKAAAWAIDAAREGDRVPKYASGRDDLERYRLMVKLLGDAVDGLQRKLDSARSNYRKKVARTKADAGRYRIIRALGLAGRRGEDLDRAVDQLLRDRADGER